MFHLRQVKETLNEGTPFKKKRRRTATSPFESSAGKPIWETYDPQALTPMAPATAEATAMMILRITSQVDFFMMLTF